MSANAGGEAPRSSARLASSTPTPRPTIRRFGSSGDSAWVHSNHGGLPTALGSRDRVAGARSRWTPARASHHREFSRARLSRSPVAEMQPYRSEARTAMHVSENLVYFP